MENQTNVGDQNTQQIGQNPISRPVQIPEKPKVNYWMISSIALIIIVVLGGAFYLLNSRKKTDTSIPNVSQTQPTGEPFTTNTSTGAITKSNQIRIFGMIFTYPEQWIPIFANQNDSKNVVYLAKNQQEAQSLISCAAQNSCSNYSLKLEDFGNAAVWQSHTIEAFIKEVRPDIQISSLQKTTVGGREAWVGYTDANKLTHQAVISTGTPQAKSFVAIKATATDKQMMEDYVALLPALIVNDYKDTKPKEISLKKGFAIELTSSLTTEDYFLLSFILDSLLAPQNSKQSYHYSLYNEAKSNPGSNVAGPNNPKGNFLNGKYYLLTNNNQLKDGVYGTPQVQIKLSTSNVNNLGSYLADPKYCQQDSDCQYRSNFCSIDAFNAYHQFYTPWGCGAPDYGSLGNYTDLQAKLNCQSDIDVKYDSLKCVNNSCQAVNAKPVCRQ